MNEFSVIAGACRVDGETKSSRGLERAQRCKLAIVRPPHGAMQPLHGAMRPPHGAMRPPHVAGIVAATLIMLWGCAPTVKVEAPDKPIEINMNVNIQHEIRIKVEKDIQDMVAENPDLF